jgi:membrane fusion protein, multidrug efflux system
MIDAGNIVHATDTTGLVVLTQTEPISVIFTLPEDDFGEVNRQMAAGPLTVAASSRADNKIFGQGTVLLINNQIDQTTGTIQLNATFPNQDRALVIKASNTVQMQPIKVSTANAGGPRALIESGVTVGEQVVIDGQLRLRSGVSVKVVPAAPATPPAPAATLAATPPPAKRVFLSRSSAALGLVRISQALPSASQK